MRDRRGRMLASGLAVLELVTAPVGGLILGYYLDQYFRTGPWLAMTCLLLGVFSGFYQMIRIFSRLQREDP